MKNFILITVLTLSIFSLWGQSVKKCDINIISEKSARLNKLKSAEIKTLLTTFDASCKNNVEFSEMSNELLFDVLDKYTKIVLQILDNPYPDIQLEAILDELSYPLLDKVDIPNLIGRVEKVKVSEQLKNKIINALQISNNQ